VALDPRVGGRIAVAEAARNVACAGGRPRAITNNLNFGNPKRPEIFFQLREAVAGIGEACRAMETPVTGGNVSLYNESPRGAIHPTPTIGMVGVVDSLSHITPSAFVTPGDAIILLGDCSDELGGSEYLLRVHDTLAGAPPACDVHAERRLIDALLSAIALGHVRSAHDVSDGGLMVALAECCMLERHRMHGASVDLTGWGILPERALLYGETQGRIIVTTVDAPAVLAVAAQHGVPARVIGHVTDVSQGLRIRTMSKQITAPIDLLAEAFHTAIPRIMDGDTPAEHAITVGHAPTT
jgi:phosphoribosylformylglycinamidine synthase subunit PurL